jgi:hypothetical protein
MGEPRIRESARRLLDRLAETDDATFRMVLAEILARPHPTSRARCDWEWFARRHLDRLALAGDAGARGALGLIAAFEELRLRWRRGRLA